MLAAIFSFAGVLYHLLGGAFGRISRSGPGSNHGTVALIFSFWAAVLFVGSAVALGIGAATEASGSDNDDESNEEEEEDDDDDDDDRALPPHRHRSGHLRQSLRVSHAVNLHMACCGQAVALLTSWPFSPFSTATAGPRHTPGRTWPCTGCTAWAGSQKRRPSPTRPPG